MYCHDLDIHRAYRSGRILFAVSDSKGARRVLLEKLSTKEFEMSRDQGCKICDLICATSQSLGMDPEDPQVAIHLDRNRPPIISTVVLKECRQNFLFSAMPRVWMWGTIPPVLPLPETPGSDESFDFVKRQLDLCISEHPECQTRKSTTAPKRLLRVGSESQSPFLIESDEQSRERYAALSYCWGGDQTLKLTRLTEATLRNSIPLKSLPILLQDAIKFCWRLEIPYLWVDALCILQGEDVKEEWREEAANMADIYGNAFVTIFTASCSNTRQSFLAHEGTLTRNPQVLLQNSLGAPLIMARRKLPLGSHSHKDSRIGLDPLEKRAWAFQEFHLSRRVVSYTSNEIQWHCQKLEICEPGCAESLFEETSRFDPDDEQDKVSLRNHVSNALQTLEDQQLFTLWQRLVQRYSRSQLTFSEDRLVALSGLATAFGRQLGSVYVAGLWTDHLIEDLLWQPDFGIEPMPAPREYIAPTFSWASLGVSIRCTEHAVKDFATIEEVQCFPRGNDAFGQITGGYLRVTGYLFEATCMLKTIDGPYSDIFSDFYTLRFQVPNSPLSGKRPFFTCDAELENITVPLTSETMINTARRRRIGTDCTNAFRPCKLWCLRLAGVDEHRTGYVTHEHYLVLASSGTTVGCYERVGKAYYGFLNREQVQEVEAADQEFYENKRPMHRGRLLEYLDGYPKTTIKII